MFSDMFRNHLLMNALLAWATAQILKFIIYLGGKPLPGLGPAAGRRRYAQRPLRHRHRSGRHLRY